MSEVVLTNPYYASATPTFYHFYDFCKSTVSVQIDFDNSKVRIHKFYKSEGLLQRKYAIYDQDLKNINLKESWILFSEGYSQECDLFSFAFINMNQDSISILVYECTLEDLECVVISRINNESLPSIKHPVKGIFYDNHILTLIDTEALRKIRTWQEVLEIQTVKHSLDQTDLIVFLYFQGVYFAVQNHGVFSLEMFYGKLRNTTQAVIKPSDSSTIIFRAANTKNHMLVGSSKETQSYHVLDPVFDGEDYKVKREGIGSLNLTGFELLYSFDSNYKPSANGLPEFRLDYQDLTIMIGKTLTPIIFNSYQATSSDPRLSESNRFSYYSTKAVERWLDGVEQEQAVIVVGPNKNEDLYHMSVTASGGAQIRKLRLTRPHLDCTRVKDSVFESEMKSITLEIFYRTVDGRGDKILPIKYRIEFKNDPNPYKVYLLLASFAVLALVLGLYVRNCVLKIREARRPVEYYPEYNEYVDKQGGVSEGSQGQQEKDKSQ